ncbi:MAG: isocitrate lyase/phosphoenolpyruvate mutase family protein [Cloacibacterium sp.]|nr:isocitrate lyase/phosphoenolpyruvate mutase family protein [Cloacibacterium sp.]
MQSNYQKFYDLHHQEKPFLLGNVWNVQSAKANENAGCKALGTSSAAIAYSLGYEDGEIIPFEEYFFIIKKIAENTHLPLSVDLESGFSKDIDKLCDKVLQLKNIGVVGINLEDSIVENGERKLIEKEEFLEKLEAIRSLEAAFFINVRIDTFLLNLPNKMEETKTRISFYQDFCDGIFLPCITDEDEISTITNFTQLPLNVMSMPNLPNFETLKNLGVKRISSGNFLNDFIYRNLEKQNQKIIIQQNFNSIFENA